MEDEFIYNPDDYDEDGFLKGSPFRCYEVVEIHFLRLATQPEGGELTGQRGVVTSFAYNDGNWAYGVGVQSGECWYLFADELTSLGIVLTQAELYGPDVKHEWARINSAGECVAGDPSFLKRGPTPLYVDLEQIVPALLHKSFSVVADAAGAVFLECEPQEYPTRLRLAKAEEAPVALQRAKVQEEAQVPHPQLA